MRTLIAVVSVLLITPVCAVAQQWQPVEQWPPFLQQDYRRANIAKPQVDTRNEQKSPNNTLPFLNEQHQATNGQTNSNQAGKSKPKHIDPQGELSVSDQIQDRLADLTLWLVVLTVIQAVIIGFQAWYGVKAANAATKSANTAERALKTVERPRLFISQWEIDRTDKGDQPVVTFLIGNAGRTPAHLRTKRVAAVLAEKLPEQPNYMRLPETGLSFTLQAGGRMKDGTPIIPLNPVDTPETVKTLDLEADERINSGKLLLYCFGSIPYTDDFRNGHEVGFLAKYNPRTKDFAVVTTHPDYNYST